MKIIRTLTFILTLSSAAQAAEIRVLCSNGLQAVMENLAPQFERTSGHKVVVTFGLAAGFKQQIEKGEAFDLAVLTPPMIDDLIKQGKMAADSRTVIARTGLGLMIRAGAKKPDVSTTDAFKRSLAGAKGIAFAKEGASGVAFTATIERLGIAESLKRHVSCGCADVHHDGRGRQLQREARRGCARFDQVPDLPRKPVHDQGQGDGA
jgi:molybdate transport system substrate-binding protein